MTIKFYCISVASSVLVVTMPTMPANLLVEDPLSETAFRSNLDPLKSFEGLPGQPVFMSPTKGGVKKTWQIIPILGIKGGGGLECG